MAAPCSSFCRAVARLFPSQAEVGLSLPEAAVWLVCRSTQPNGTARAPAAQFAMQPLPRSVHYRLVEWTNERSGLLKSSLGETDISLTQ